MSNGILKNKSIVVIGAGNMGGAILTGAVKSGVATAADVTAVDLDEGLLAQHKDQLGVKTSTDAGSVVGDADLILLALKPQIWKAVVNLFAGAVSPTATVVSIMAGIRTDALEKVFSDGVAIVRSMPNLMAQVGEAASGLCAGRAAREDNLAQAEALLGAVGMTVRVDESQMDAVTGLSGSGPAFVFVLIDALADGGVRAGLPRPIAQQLATQTVLGAAKMVLESNESPSVLKERVTSPGGTTIAGIRALEDGGFRASLMAAVEAASARSQELSES
jgi:pyrroline-5-carboxylate reductase